MVPKFKMTIKEMRGILAFYFNIHPRERASKSEISEILASKLQNYHGPLSSPNIIAFLDQQGQRENIQQQIQPARDPVKEKEDILKAAKDIKDIFIVRQVNQGQDVEYDFGLEPVQTQEAYILALIDALKEVKTNLNKKTLILRLKYGDNLECMRTLNNGTISHLLHLINVLDGKAADDVEDFTDSDQAVLMGLMTLKGYALEWYEYKRPAKAGAYFTYYNLNKELNLSIFGIYH